MFQFLKKLHRSDKWQRGQAMVEYWPTIPVGVMVMIAASAIVGPIGHIFHQTADSLNLVVCGDAPPAYFTLPIGQVVEILGSAYDAKTDRSTFTLSVPSGDQVILGFDEDTAQRIAQASENFDNYAQDPTTGKWGIKFDPGNSGNNGNNGNGGPKKGSVFSPAYGTSDAREITLTLSGEVDFVNNLEVTVIDSNNNVSSGYIYTTVTASGEDCSQSVKPHDQRKGNNGVGNGYDDQPPGNPPENDTCADAAPGSPCNKQLGKTKK